MKHIISACALIAVASCSRPTPTDSSQLLNYPGTGTVSRYLVDATNRDKISAIAERFDVEGMQGNQAVVYVPAARQSEFQDAVPDAKLDSSDISEQPEVLRYDFAKVETRLLDIAKNRSDIATLDVYGKTTKGRKLYSLKVAKAGSKGKAQVMITGATHGNEVLTVDVVMGLIEDLMMYYGKDARLTKIVDEHELYFVPVVSPDSYVAKSRYVDGVDPNRDYPHPDAPNHKTSSSTIQALIDFTNSKQLVASIDYHSLGGMIMYPWAYTKDSPGKDAAIKFDSIGKNMAKANGYKVGQISRILYVAKGSSADYYYWKKGTFGLGIELSKGIDVTVNSGFEMFKENRESTWRFVESF